MNELKMACIIDGKGYECHTVTVEYLTGETIIYKAKDMNILYINAGTTRAISIAQS